jgi:hypothetical protein
MFCLGNSIFAQEGKLNSDKLREQIRSVETIRVDGKSAVVQNAHKRVLLALYEDLRAALESDLQDLRSIREAAGVDRGQVSRDLDAQISATQKEQEQVVARIQGLSSGSGTDNTAGNGVSENDTNGSSRSERTTRSSTRSGNLSSTRNNGSSEPVNGNASRTDTFANNGVSGAINATTTTATPQAAGANPSTSINASLNQAIQAKIEQRDAGKQTETPSTSSNSTSLVDTSSAGDLVNVGLNLAGLTGATKDNSTDSNSVSVTTSAYALYAGFLGADPLNPGFYNRNAAWRRLSFTLGYDDEKDTVTNVSTQAKIFGVKYLIINKRDPTSARNDKYFRIISNDLQTRTTAFGNLFEKVIYHVSTIKAFRDKILIPQFRAYLQVKRQEAAQSVVASDPERLARIDDLLLRVNSGAVFLLDQNGVQPAGPLAEVRSAARTATWKKEEADFWEQIGRDYFGTDYRNKLKTAVGNSVVDEIDAFVEKQLNDANVFQRLQESSVAREAIENIRKAPQFSLYVLTKQRQAGVDEYTGEAIFDYGLANRVNLTLNGNFLYKNSPFVGGDTRAGKFSGQFRFQVTPEKLVGRNPLFFFVSGNGEALSGRKPIFQAQAKLSVPLLNGLDLPFSLTYANRNVQNKKDFVKFQFAFAIDTARILQALTGK